MRDDSTKKLVPKFWTIAIGLIGITAIFLAAQLKPGTPKDFSAGVGLTVEQAERSFAETDRNEDLYQLLLSLCYHNQEDPQERYVELMAHYGAILHNRAKEGTLDLETIGDTAVTMDMLEYIAPYLDAD